MRIFENICCMEGMEKYKDVLQARETLAILDPPYGIGDVNQSKSRKIHKKITWNDSTPTEEYFNLVKILSRNRIIWGANYYGKFIDDVGRIIHDKCPLSNQQLKEFSDADIASHSFGVNIKLFRYEWRGNVQGDTINWDNTGPDARIHPVQKPLALYRFLLQNYLREHTLILDTHVGSASSLIVCEEFGIDYIGFELDPDHYQKAKARIEKARFERENKSAPECYTKDLELFNPIT